MQLNQLLNNLHNNLFKYFNLLSILHLHGGVPIFVGGCIRDSIMQLKTNDYDLEVHCITQDHLNNILNKNEIKYAHVGKIFGVFKIEYLNTSIDISMPRNEKSTGLKHTDFKVDFKRYMSYKQAAKRRDFTINSIGYMPIYRVILDPLNGINDIQKGVIKMANEKTFLEDPLRIMRAIYFACKLSFKIDENLLKYINENIEILINLSNTRIQKEIYKILLTNNIKFAIDYLSQYKLDCLIIFHILKQFSYNQIHNINRLKTIISKIFFIKQKAKNQINNQLFIDMPNIKTNILSNMDLLIILLEQNAYNGLLIIIKKNQNFIDKFYNLNQMLYRDNNSFDFQKIFFILKKYYIIKKEIIYTSLKKYFILQFIPYELIAELSNIVTIYYFFMPINLLNNDTLFYLYFQYLIFISFLKNIV